MKPRPTISIVIEGLNESQERGAFDNTISALRLQDFPLGGVELIVAGSAKQMEEWAPLCQNPQPFFAVQAITADGANYYELKNKGALAATGEIIAFTDSDVFTESRWISSIVANIKSGRPVSVGLTLFKDRGGWTATSIFRQMAASCTFGYILGPDHGEGVELRGFTGHNVAMKAEIVERQKYRTDFGRLLASALLFRSLQQEGFKIRFTGTQAAVHHFSWYYWLENLHFRFGYEVYQLRRLDKHYPNPWIGKTGIFEPLVTMFWHILLDVPRWLRFCKAREIATWKAWLPLPCLVLLSTTARGEEMLGMYSTIFWPEPMTNWAEQG